MDDDSGTGLPASVEAAWGLRERPGKGPRPGLSLERIVDAGVRIADSDGLAAVSMSRVAGDLGVSTMSLYRYLAAKDELLTLMLDAACGQPPDVTQADDGWRGGLSRWTWAYRAVLEQHAWMVRVPISGPPATPNNVAWFEHGLRCLHGTGLEADEKVQVILLLTGLTRNSVRLAVDLSEAGWASGSTAQDAAAGYGRLLAKLIDPERFPALTAVVDAGVFDYPVDTEDPDDDFAFGLERVLDGIDRLVRTRAR